MKIREIFEPISEIVRKIRGVSNPIFGIACKLERVLKEMRGVSMPISRIACQTREISTMIWGVGETGSRETGAGDKNEKITPVEAE